jgi:hypothetical protein
VVVLIGGNIFHRPQRHAVNGMGQANAAIDGAVFQLLAIGLADHHGAGAAVAFATAFLGAGAVQVFTQQLQQGAVGFDVGQGYDCSTPEKSQGFGVHGG